MITSRIFIRKLQTVQHWGQLHLKRAYNLVVEASMRPVGGFFDWVSALSFMLSLTLLVGWFMCPSPQRFCCGRDGESKPRGTGNPSSSGKWPLTWR